MSLRRIRVGKLLDGTGAPPLEDAPVLIDGERIVALGSDASVPSPDSAERLDSGEPRLSISGRPITMTGGHYWPFGGEADGTDAVREAVRQMVKEGADWIKIMATGGGTPGTQPYRASFSVEELTAAVDQAHALNRLTGSHAGSIVNPTLHIRRVRVWRLERLSEERQLTEEEATELATQRRFYDERGEYFRGLIEAGVRQVAGSDSGYSYFRVGDFADEVEAMSSQGMGPAAAIRAATLDSAESIGMGHDVGSLQVGKYADLLLIAGDPSTDISALKRVGAVFVGGQRVR
jgi:imidazolonepropionase-like amidohydrolase